MITHLFWMFVVLSSLVAVKNWRLGLMLLVTVGALQDPVRKMTPGTPAFMVLCFFPVWLGAIVGVITSHEWAWYRFGAIHPKIQARMRFFVAALGLATVVVFQYGFIAWKVAMIGLFSYSVPLLTMIMGFALVRNSTDLTRFVVFYCVITAIMLTGGVMQVLGLFPNLKAIGTQALGMHWIKYVSYGHTLDLMAGFYRSPDIMGWHAATLLIFSLMLALYGRAGPRWFWLVMAVWGALCVFISGRNKMLGMAVIWVIGMALLYLYIGRAGRVVTMGLAGAVLALSVLLISGKLNINSDYDLYASQLVGSDLVANRVQHVANSGFWITYEQSGFLGKGIGTAAQGIQYLGLPLRRSWQEAGISKLLVELGVTGVIAAALMGLATFRAMLAVIRYSRNKGILSPLQLGLTSYVAANVANFAISQQAYSDGTIMVIVSVSLASMLASPLWLQQESGEGAESLSRG